MSCDVGFWQKVAYSATFLRSIGWRDAGKLCGLRGIVIDIKDDPLYLIDWGNYQSYVNKFNLVNINTMGGLQADAEKSQVYGYNENYKKNDF